MTWSQWVEVYFDNKTDKHLEAKNVKITAGWTYVTGDAGRKEMSTDEIHQLNIKPYASEDPGFGNTGYSWPIMKGCEGSLDLYSKGEGTRVCSINWNCPYWTKQNSFNVMNIREGWVVKRQGGQMYATDIGAVYVKISRPN
ncbi:hypothetical protein M3J09_005068 [Ascochyta lentis]